MPDNKLTLGSLFDGSGGFPLGGLISGIEPLFASEIEPFPIRVTTKRMPFIKHYGDVSALNGAEVEPVDIITFGSPCQDMSIAGKRAGLEGSRSNLFYEAIRIVKEMREKTNGEKPRYIVWENVPGAFSSNKGEDFRAVLEAVCSVKESEIDIPRYEKWPDAGLVMADDFSVAWRVLDAQYWGVPQRRKRIYLVADFTGQCAGKILFESESVSGYLEKSRGAWQSSAADVKNSVGETGAVDGYNGAVTDKAATLGVNCGMSTGRNGVMVLNDQGGERMDITEDVTNTLRAESHHTPIVTESAGFCTEHSSKARSVGFEKEKSPTLRAGTVPAAVFENHSADTRYTGPLTVSQTVLSTFGTGGNNQPFVVEDKKAFDVRLTSLGTKNVRANVYETDTSRTIDCGGNSPANNQGGVAVVCIDQGAGKSGCGITKDVSPTLACTHGGAPAMCLQGSMIGRKDENGPQGSGVNEDIAFTLNATDKHAVAFAKQSAALSANDGPKGPSSQQLKNPEENFVLSPSYGIDRATYNMGKNAQFDISIREEVEPSMVAKGPGAVAHPVYHSSKASFHTNFSDDTASDTLVATDYKDPPTVTEKPYYIVRRLTPTECARLQGFPDWWCSDLGTENPTDEEIAFWRDVFETHRKVTGASSKPKRDSQIIKWLKDPHSDSAEYKMWGNGVCLNNVIFVLSGIVYYDSLSAE